MIDQWPRLYEMDSSKRSENRRMSETTGSLGDRGKAFAYRRGLLS